MNNKKQIVFNADVQEKIGNGVRKLCDAVKVTLGPTGRVVMIERDYGDPYVTKDGVTVAKEVNLEDPLENMGAQLVKQAANKTASVAGDGTTTATIYTDAIYKTGLKYIANGAKAQEVKRGVDKAVAAVVADLAAHAKPVLDEMAHVAICSANQDVTIGNLVADAIGKVGSDGVVTIEEGKTLDTHVDVVDGLQFDRGYLNPNFVTDKERMRVEYEKPLIMLTDYRIGSVKSIMHILEFAISKGQPLIVVADDVDGEALATMVVNYLRGTIKCVAVKAPGYGDRRSEMLEDLAIVTGGAVISQSNGIALEKADPNGCLGTCARITIDQDTTTIIGGAGEEEHVVSRIEHIKNRLASTANDFDREKLQERLAKLTGGVARIVVGGATEAEIREKKDRIDDALRACKAASEEGILPGGGIAPIYAANALKKLKGLTADEQLGVDIVKRAVEEPLRQIARNTGIDEGAVLANILRRRDRNYGYNAAINKYGDMLKFGVIVPAKVERVALQNAASVAGLMLTTDCMISIIPAATEAAGNGLM